MTFLIDDKVLKSHINNMLDFFMNDTTDTTYKLVSTQTFDAKSKTWIEKICDLDDIGDYLTFIAWHGKLFNHKPSIEFSKIQFNIWNSKMKTPTGFYHAKWKNNTKPNISDFQIISLYDHHDAFLGMYELFLVTNDQNYAKECIAFSQLLSKIVKKFDGLVPNRIIGKPLIALPWTTSSPTVNGLFAEQLALSYSMFHEKTFLRSAAIILKKFFNKLLIQK